MLSHGKMLDIYKCQDLNKYNGRMAGEQGVDFESMEGSGHREFSSRFPVREMKR